MPRGPREAATRHLDPRRAGPDEILSFLGSPQVCEVDALFPTSLDRELWSLAALGGGASQLGFRGSGAAVHAAVDVCTATRRASVDAYGSALRAAGECHAHASGSCSPNDAREIIAALADRWRLEAGAVARMQSRRGAIETATSLLAPLGNETSIVLMEYTSRIQDAMIIDADAEPPGMQVETTHENGTDSLTSTFTVYHILTNIAMQLARHVREMMENLRLVWGIRNLAVELASVYPNILEELPPVVYHTEVYGRHWDLLETLLLSLDSERDAASPPLRMAEMGVACGPIGLHLLLRFPELVYHGADPTIRPEVYDAYQRFGPRATLHAIKSEELYQRLPEDELFDFVFIDGPHTYQNVRNDIELWQTRVRKGGILAGHDFTCSHPPLLWAVLERRMLAGGQQMNVGIDGVWWWRVE